MNKEQMTIKALFDTSKTQAGRRLSKYTYPWEHNIGDKVNLGAAFCLGRCTDGVTIKIDDEIICGVNENNFQQIFDEKVLVCLD